MPVERADADVLAQPQSQEQAFFVTVIRNKADSSAAGCGGGRALDELALDPHRSALAPLEAGDGTQKFALTLAFDAGHTDDLAGVGGKIDIRKAGRRRDP